MYENTKHENHEKERETEVTTGWEGWLYNFPTVFVFVILLMEGTRTFAYLEIIRSTPVQQRIATCSVVPNISKSFLYPTVELA